MYSYIKSDEQRRPEGPKKAEARPSLGAIITGQMGQWGEEWGDRLILG